MGRPPKYEWEDKRDICYQLHVEQKLSGSQIVKHFAEHFGVPSDQLPGVNQFYARFRLWGFPSRKNWFTAEDKERIVARTRELFNQNCSAQDTLTTLQEEGWDIDRYQFRVLRRKHGMILRSAPGYRRLADTPKKRKLGGEENEDEEDDRAGAHEDGPQRDSEPAPAQEQCPPPEEAARRAQRMADLEMQSDQLLQARKRRRRIRGYGHLPPDAPGMQPRYNSETSLDECKAFLQLSNEDYVAVREQFSAICRDLGIVKMSLCQEGQWQAGKDQLVRGNAHLSTTLHPQQGELDKKLNALNCICTDVTKRMRNQSRFMSIAEANNALQLNPAESKDIRRLLYDILAADQFTSMITCGKERMDELRLQWYARSPTLQKVVQQNDAQKNKALDVLCKDVRKRFCDDQGRKNPTKQASQKQNHYGPGPGPALPTNTMKGSGRKERTNASDLSSESQGSMTFAGLVSYNADWDPSENPGLRYSSVEDVTTNFDLDPLLTRTVHGPPWPPTDSGQDSHGPIPTSEQIRASAQASIAAASVTFSATFHLASDSSRLDHRSSWEVQDMTKSIESVHAAARTMVVGRDSLSVAKVNGTLRHTDGSEEALLIESDDDLHGYLAQVNDKAEFSVLFLDKSS